MLQQGIGNGAFWAISMDSSKFIEGINIFNNMGTPVELHVWLSLCVPVSLPWLDPLLNLCIARPVI